MNWSLLTNHFWLVVSIPLKNTNQWEGLSHILWKNVWNHQPDFIHISLLFFSSFHLPSSALCPRDPVWRPSENPPPHRLRRFVGVSKARPCVDGKASGDPKWLVYHWFNPSKTTKKIIQFSVGWSNTIMCLATSKTQCVVQFLWKVFAHSMCCRKTAGLQPNFCGIQPYGHVDSPKRW